MKKLVLTVVTIFAVYASNAQDVKFGAKAGANLASMTNIDYSKMKVGFHFGAFAQIKLDENFAFQPELLYSTQGTKLEFSEGDGNSSIAVKGNLTTSYLNVPIMLKCFVDEKVSLEAGPQIGFLLSAESDNDVTMIDSGSIIINESSTEDVKDQLKTVDFGLNFGLGYKFSEKISAGVRYNLGLSRVQKELENGEKASKNSVFQISLGYSF